MTAVGLIALVIAAWILALAAWIMGMANALRARVRSLPIVGRWT
jgi:hypothetical protein